MPRRSHLRLALALVCSVGVAAAACSKDEGPLELVGPVERTLIELVATEAETILELPVARGEPLREGQLVVLLDSTLARVGVAEAEAAAAGARTGLVVAYHDLERVRELHRRGAASAQDLDRGLLVHDEAQARLLEAEARLQAARKRSRDLELVAPGSGTLDQLPFERGERVPAGAVVAVILADDEPWVRVWVPETRVAQVAPGTPAEIRVDGVARTLTGSVMDVAHEPEFTPHYALTERDRVHLVYESRILIHDAPASLRPGAPAEVRLELPVSAPAT